MKLAVPSYLSLYLYHITVSTPPPPSFDPQTLTDLMGAKEIQELDEVGEGTLHRQRESEAEKKRRKLAEDMEKEQKERIRKKQELLRKEKDLEKVITTVAMECHNEVSIICLVHGLLTSKGPRVYPFASDFFLMCIIIN